MGTILRTIWLASLVLACNRVNSEEPSSSGGPSAVAPGSAIGGSQGGPRIEARAELPGATSVAPGPAESLRPPEPQVGDLPLADLDPDNDTVVAPPELFMGCETALERLSVKVRRVELPLRQKLNGAFTCGAPLAYVYEEGPLGLGYNSRPIVTCQMALGLAYLERVVSEAAQTILGEAVSRVTHGGTYNCRKMTRFPRMVSEHSYGNAIDIHSFTLKSGRVLTVKKGFGPLDREVTSKDATFLRSVASRLYDQAVFSVVLTPFFDAHHHDHFHLDQARYRVDGTRPGQPLPGPLGAPP